MWPEQRAACALWPPYSTPPCLSSRGQCALQAAAGDLGRSLHLLASLPFRGGVTREQAGVTVWGRCSRVAPPDTAHTLSRVYPTMHARCANRFTRAVLFAHVRTHTHAHYTHTQANPVTCTVAHTHTLTEGHALLTLMHAPPQVHPPTHRFSPRAPLPHQLSNLGHLGRWLGAR